jgi:hypothetical protein
MDFHEQTRELNEDVLLAEFYEYVIMMFVKDKETTSSKPQTSSLLCFLFESGMHYIDVPGVSAVSPMGSSRIVNKDSR